MEPFPHLGLISVMGHSEAQPKILVVEDELFIRMSAVATLKDAGFFVLEDGLALVAQVQIDHPDIRSIVVSGNASAVQARSAGAFGFVAKPYLAKTIVQAVHDTVLRH